MGFPATNTFQSAVGPVAVTITGHPETGEPHLMHFSTEAGLCAHFLVREWSQLNEHVQDIIRFGRGAEPEAEGGDQAPAVPAQRENGDDDPAPSGQGAPVTPDQPFLPPTAAGAEGSEA